MLKIDQLIHNSCLKHADRVAFKHKINGQWKEIHYGRFWNNVEKLTAGLQQLGIKQGTHIAILAPSSPRWVTSYLAILYAGGVTVPIDKELKAAELRHILGDADAQAIIVGQAQFDTLLEVIDDLPDLKNIILIDTPIEEMGDQDDIIETMQELKTLWQQLVADLDIVPERREPLEAAAQQLRQLVTSSPETSEKKKKERHFLSDAELIRNRLLKEKRLFSYKAIFADIPVVANSAEADQCAVILYTSGTTGRAKGAMLSHGNIVSNIEGARQHFKLDNSIATLSFLPINHVFEQVCGILLPLALGGQISFAESIKKLGDNLNEIKPTFLLGVPAVYRLLYDRIMKKIDTNTSSRLLYKFSLTRNIVTANVKKAVGENTTFVSGGAALDPAISDGFRHLGLTLYQGYGITETSPVISAESPFKNQPGTVGECLKDVQVRIDNPNADGEGEIQVKGPNVMLGYYKNPAATAEVLQEGWYRTGDLGRIDTNGMLCLRARVKNLIVTPNGKNVYPEEVENQRLLKSYIAEIMVYGRSIGEDGYEGTHAVIFPDEGPCLPWRGRQRGQASFCRRN